MTKRVITKEYVIEPGADLRGTDLTYAKVTKEQLAQATTNKMTKGV